jgi:hypothetical protein
MAKKRKTNRKIGLYVMVHAYNPTALEADKGGSCLEANLGKFSETLCQKTRWILWYMHGVPARWM